MYIIAVLETTRGNRPQRGAMAKNNILVVCLEKNFRREFSCALATQLKMFFADVDDIIEHENMQLKELVKFKGDGFYERLEQKTLDNVCNLNNAVINAPLNSLLAQKNLQRVRVKCFVIFARVSKDFLVRAARQENLKSSSKLVIEEVVFDERTRIFENEADITIDCGKDVSRDVKKTIKEIEKFFEAMK